MFIGWSSRRISTRLHHSLRTPSSFPFPLPSFLFLSSFLLFSRGMKTFVPFAGCTPEEGVLRSLLCLDDKRLGKQRVESPTTTTPLHP